ncbi:MAG: ABC transporter substrate-binding protein [Rhodospirillales bacterium]|nr:ABC transporter substrate-binding protein [Rhodospirillales bacterium]
MKMLIPVVLLCLGLVPVAAARNADIIRIGIINDQSSVFSDADGMNTVLAAKMAVEDFGGKVLGKPVEIIAADHQGKPDIGAGLAREMLDQKGVSAIVVGGNSAVVMAIQEITKQSGHVMMNVIGISSALSNAACSPTGFHWFIDTYSAAKTYAIAVTKEGGKNWFIIAPDYTFGHAFVTDLTKQVTKAGGKVVGTVFHPLGQPDFGSLILQAQASNADVIAFSTSGLDFNNAIKQAHEFGLNKDGRRIIGMVVDLLTIHAIGIELAQGLEFVSPGEWNQSPEAERFSRRFMEHSKAHTPPTSGHMAAYSVVGHYLKAVQAAGTTDGPAVAAKMKELPVDDFYANGAKVRADGRLMIDIKLMRVKPAAEQKGPFDYTQLISSTPGVDAFRPASESECPLLKQP